MLLSSIWKGIFSDSGPGMLLFVSIDFICNTIAQGLSAENDPNTHTLGSTCQILKLLSNISMCDHGKVLCTNIASVNIYGPL